MTFIPGAGDGSAGGRWYSGGSGGGGGGASWSGADWTQQLFNDGLLTEIKQPTKDKDNDMKYTNEEAKKLANEILAERRTEGLRERVEAAVTHLTELFAGAGDGSVFSFAREFDEKTWHYAAIKSGGKWFSTGNVTALQAATDDELITWLIGLEIYAESDMLAVAKTTQPALIEGTATDD
jgi:hypothetical protein